MGIRFYWPIEALRGIVARLYVHASDAAAAYIPDDVSAPVREAEG